MVLIALLAAHGIELLRRYGLPRWGGWGLALLFAFAPANLFLPITIWKDIPFAISLFGMYLIGLEIALTGGASIRQGKRWVWLGIAAVGTALYRHNPTGGKKMTRITLTLNDEKRIADVDADTRLIDMLRDDFHLVSVREGCSAGECGEIGRAHV